MKLVTCNCKDYYLRNDVDLFKHILNVVNKTATVKISLDLSNNESYASQINKINMDYPDVNKYIKLVYRPSRHVKHLYVFERCNSDFIEAIEHALNTIPSNINVENAQFVINEIDDRFSDPIYYKININEYTNINECFNHCLLKETFEINYEQIINDLWNHKIAH